MENLKHTEEEVLKIARQQYKNVGFDSEKDGTLSLYCAGVRFGYLQALERSNAPELLEALQMCVMIFEDNGYKGVLSEEKIFINNAIKKATE